MEYEEMLKRAYKNMPEKAKSGERFEPPEADAYIEGNKTIIRNFKEMANALHRDPALFQKFISKELAVPANIDGSRLILKARIPLRILNAKITAFIEEYVLCKECKKPDTKIIEEHGVKMLKCEACGAKRAIRELK